MSDRPETPDRGHPAPDDATVPREGPGRRRLMARVARALARRRVETLLRDTSAPSAEVVDAIGRLRAIETAAEE